MVVEDSAARTAQGNKTRFWAKTALSVRDGIGMHQVSGQLTKDPETHKRPWGNVSEHCLVQVARVETLGKWIGLPVPVTAEMKVGAVLHDFHKRQDITATRLAIQAGGSPLATVRAEQQKGDDLLRTAGFSNRVRRLASSAGGDTPQLIEAQRILDQETLSDDDWAYLVVHYVDDCSIGADWVIPSQVGTGGKRINIIDFRAAGNKAKPEYAKISQQVTAELSGHPVFGGMSNYDSWSLVFHQIEQRLAKKISERTGEAMDPLTIPELVDQKIRDAIAAG